MSLSTSIWAILLSLVVYVACVDENVPIFLVLLFRWAKISVRKAYLTLALNPEMPWIEWSVKKNAEQNAVKLAKELGLYDNEDWHK